MTDIVSPTVSARKPRDPTVWVGIAGVVALVLPVLLYGPWLPLLDLVGFVGMYSYPPQLSYGPLHYYTFQFSYSGVLAISRLFCDLGLPPRFQIPLYYLFEVGVCFGVVYGLLKRVVANVPLRCFAVALGTLAFWDGVFLWGGPLAHSLGAACLSWATYLTMRDADEPQRNSSVYIAFLSFFAVYCHPFAFPFALVLCCVRFLFNPRHRWQTVGLAVAILIYGVVIVRDSPAAEVGEASGKLFTLFGFRPSEMLNRVAGLFRQDIRFADALFGQTPFLSQIVFLVLGAFHFAGFIAAPFLAWKRQGSIWLRMLMTLTTAAAILYLFSFDLPESPIGEWPQRILTLYAPFTFVAGCVAMIRLIDWLRHGAPFIGPSVSPFTWAGCAALLVFAIAVQGQVLRLSRVVESGVARTRSEILKSGVTDAYVVPSGMDNVKPFYLRCIPFVLFSDRDLIAAHITMSTEWHIKDRHPTRVTESMFNLGRKRYLAEFSAQDSVVSVRMIEQPMNRFPVIERTDQFTWATPGVLALDQFHTGIGLFRSGVYASALEHFNTAIYLEPKFAAAWNDGGAALTRVGRMEDAITYYQNAIQRDPGLLDARTNIAVALIGIGRPKEALPQLEAALKIDPNSAMARRLLEQANAALAVPTKPLVAPGAPPAR